MLWLSRKDRKVIKSMRVEITRFVPDMKNNIINQNMVHRNNCPKISGGEA